MIYKARSVLPEQGICHCPHWFWVECWLDTLSVVIWPVLWQPVDTCANPLPQIANSPCTLICIFSIGPPATFVRNINIDWPILWRIQVGDWAQMSWVWDMQVDFIRLSSHLQERTGVSRVLRFFFFLVRSCAPCAGLSIHFNGFLYMPEKQQEISETFSKNVLHWSAWCCRTTLCGMCKNTHWGAINNWLPSHKHTKLFAQTWQCH